MDNLNNIIEAILFTSGDGLSSEYLAEKLGITEKEVTECLTKLQQKYSGFSGIHLIKFRKNYQFCSNSQYSGEIATVLNPIKERNLTKAALETMAIIAYKQPITRLEIEDIRGVDSTYPVSVLQSNGLIDIVGRKDTIGKPYLFGTTDTFLKRFELESIEQLPSYEQLLEKIKVIHTKEQENKTIQLYNSNRAADVLSDLPEFLEGESVEVIE